MGSWGDGESTDNYNERDILAPAVELSLAEFDCWRTSTVLDVLELKLLESIIQSQ
jgi:hypothetical protein